VAMAWILVTVILNLVVCILLRVLNQVQEFPSNATVSIVVYYFIQLAATCFGRTIIFKWKYIEIELR
jgi:hypothetical protein